MVTFVDRWSDDARRKRISFGTFHFLIISEMMLNGWQNEKGAAGRETLSQVKRVEIARSSLLGNLRWTGHDKGRKIRRCRIMIP